jgi:bacterioferritin-associated ferredoxin
MIVCVCKRVSDKTIAQSAQQGAGFDDIQMEYGVATQCGKCECTARRIWSECHGSHRMAHLQKEVMIPIAMA